MVPNIEQFIYCLSGNHLLAVYTAQKRYVLNFLSPVEFTFPLLEKYEVPSYCKVSVY